jgi:S-formylglutathione hydrolase FrmB
MVLGMPSDGLWGQGSGYLTHGGRDHGKWIVEDVVDAIREAIPAAGAESPVFIAGLSMGGFGALRLAAVHPGRFAAASGHSSVTSLEELKRFLDPKHPAFEVPAAEETSVLESFLEHKASLPPIRFDCGTSDFLIDSNRALHAGLDSAGIPHRYQEFSGDHEWAYWKSHLADSLLFFEETMVKKTPSKIH